MPIPPVTSTVVEKIGEIPFVPPTMGAILTNGTYELAFFPIHNATLFTQTFVMNQLHSSLFSYKHD